MSEISPLLWLLPFIAGCIGWFTNFIAVKMLFRPIKAIRIWGLKFQGVIPKRHHDLAHKIADSITKDFLSQDDIKSLIAKVDFEPLLKKIIIKKWDEKIDDVLADIPMIQMFLSADKIESIRDKLVAAFCDSKGTTAEIMAIEISRKIDLRDMIYQNILNFDLETLEGIIQKIAKKEFRFVERLGGVIGFIIGGIQLAIAVIST
jgi:uncharacterized membrane protein YheB (UPF0754 family)